MRDCDIIHIKIKSFLYSRESTKPISATLRLGTGQHSKKIYD